MVTMLVSFISARLVLQALGVSDYGLYGVVGGVIALFTFFSSALVETTTRFINYEMGKADKDLNRVFNISNTLHLYASFLVLLVLETLGVIYIKLYLNVLPGKESDAMFVFQISTIVACIGITNIPYRALFVAYEKFGTIAKIEIFNTLLKLLLICFLFFYNGNVLRLYAICMSVSTFISFIIYRYLARKGWPDIVENKRIVGIKNYREQLFYNMWSLFATVASITRSQGSNLLINFFFGTAINAAYTISTTVQAGVEVLSSNFTKSAAPQITRSLGAQNEDSLSRIYRASRLNFLLSEITFFPILIELELLLKFWLGNNIPPYTLLFCQTTLLIGLVASTRSGVVLYLRGIGKVKECYIMMSTFFILCIPIGFCLYKLGYPPFTICVVFVVADVINRIAELVLLKRKFRFDIKQFVKQSWLRPLLVFLILSALALSYWQLSFAYLWAKCLGILSMLIVSILISFYIGLLPQEKVGIVNYLRKILVRK